MCSQLSRCYPHEKLPSAQWLRSSRHFGQQFETGNCEVLVFDSMAPRFVCLLGEASGSIVSREKGELVEEARVAIVGV